MEGTATRLSEKEQKELMYRSANGIAALKAWKECMKEDREEGAEEDPMEKILQNVIETFTVLRKQWLLSIGEPEEISGATLQKILDAALRILREELSKGTL